GLPGSARLPAHAGLPLRPADAGRADRAAAARRMHGRGSMKTAQHCLPGSLRLAALTALLAALTLGVALGAAGKPSWAPRWYPPAHAVLLVCSAALALLILATGVRLARHRGRCRAQAPDLSGTVAALPD